MTAQELKNSILQLAIQGKLVKQNPNDEPASVLLEKIKEEREKLIKEKKIKREKYSEIYKDPSDNHYYEKFEDGTINDITEEIPFEIPDSWRWTRINCYVQKVTDYVASGSFASLNKNVKYYKEKNYALLLRTIDLSNDFKKDFVYTDKHGYEFLENSNLFGGELVLSNVGSIGKVFIVPKLEIKMTLAPNSIMVRCFSEEHISWLYNLFNSTFGLNILLSISSATAIKKFNKTGFKKLMIPIPPLDEQKRIADKLEVFLSYIEKYHDFYSKLEILNTNYKDELKKSILQYAIQGKLVKQDFNDESSEILINRILDEKRELIKTKQIKKENLSVIYKDDTDNQFYEKFDDGTIVNITDEIPFDIPSNWRWNRLGNISTYGMTKNKINSKNANPDTWLLDMEDIEKGGKILIKNKLKDKNSIGDKTIFKKGNILYSKLRPYLKKILIAPEDGICTPELVPFDILGNMNSIFIINYLKSPYVDFKINQLTYGAKMPRVGTETMINLLIPIPPINEQEKIIKKINKIFKTAE